MYTPWRSAAAIRYSPGLASRSRPLIVIDTVVLAGTSTPWAGMSVTGHRQRDQYTVVGPHSSLELVGEKGKRRVHRRVGRWSDEADGGHSIRERHCRDAQLLAGGMGEGSGADRLPHLGEQIKIGPPALPCHDPGQYPLQPGTALATGGALPTGFVGVEATQRERGGRNVGGGVHHHHGARAQHRALGTDQTAFEGKIELVLDEPRRRAPARDEVLQRVVIADAATELV